MDDSHFISQPHVFFLGQSPISTKGYIKVPLLPNFPQLPSWRSPSLLPQTCCTTMTTVTEHSRAPLMGQTPAGHQSHMALFQNTEIQDPHQTFGGRLSKIGAQVSRSLKSPQYSLLLSQAETTVLRCNIPNMGASLEYPTVWWRWAWNPSHQRSCSELCR